MQATIRDHVSHIGSSRFQCGITDFCWSGARLFISTFPILGRANHQRRSLVNVRRKSFDPKAVKAGGRNVPRYIGVLLVAGFACGSASLAAGARPLIELPPAFWKAKPYLQKRLNEEQAVLVSVRTEDGRIDPEADRLVMSGVGWVKQAPAEVFARTQDFERLKEISEHFREVKYESKTERLFIVSQALGYQARMLFQLKFDRAERKIHFEVIDGHFLGLRGLVEMASIGDSKIKDRDRVTELSILMAHEARTLPVPKILIGFALEVIAKNVAVKMRRHLETPKK